MCTSSTTTATAAHTRAKEKDREERYQQNIVQESNKPIASSSK